MNVIKGNILSVERGVILHQVNCQGVMRSGVAGALRAKYPAVFSDYVAFVGPPATQPNYGALYLGEIVVSYVTPDLQVISMFGQQFFGRERKRYTSYDALDECLKKVKAYVNEGTEIHHPMLGAGLGGGNWNVIATLIEENLGQSTLWVLE